MAKDKLKFETTRKQFESALLEHNYSKIGGGSFANVFAKPGSNIAVKVAELPDGWPAYIKWATKEGFAGTFAPKVYSFKSYMPEGLPPYYVATMERLVDTVGNMMHSKSMSELYMGLVDAIQGRDDEGIKQFADLNAFAKSLKENQFKWDLHGSNVMVRKDGQIVVTDPMSDDRSSDFRIRKGQVIQAQA